MIESERTHITLPLERPHLFANDKKEIEGGIFFEFFRVEDSKLHLAGWRIGNGSLKIFCEGSALGDVTETVSSRDDVRQFNRIKQGVPIRGFHISVDVAQKSEVTILWSSYVNDKKNDIEYLVPLELDETPTLNCTSLEDVGAAGNIEAIRNGTLFGWIAQRDNYNRTIECTLYAGSKNLLNDLAVIERKDVVQALDCMIAYEFGMFLRNIPSKKLGAVLKQKGEEIDFSIGFEGISPRLILSEAQADSLLKEIKKLAESAPLEARGGEEIREWSETRGAQRALQGQSHENKVVAFYLPQYHTIPENDQWWGKGFTEWSNVSTAKPAYNGHIQPKVPADLGYYDASKIETLSAQVKLAQDYGVHGFCYYYYWFNGRRVLNKPLDLLIRSDIDFPFMICWANENWTRRWDGLDQDILLHQTHDFSKDVEFIDDIMPYLNDPRYIEFSPGVKWLVVYRPSLMPNAAEVFGKWREKAEAYGVKIHISTVTAFDQYGDNSLGVDSFIQFPPASPVMTEAMKLEYVTNTGFEEVNIFEYSDYRDLCLAEYANYLTSGSTRKLTPGAMPGWDNSARKKTKANIFDGGRPSSFKYWIENIVELQRQHQKKSTDFIFVNAWNEWAEGAYLEPDRYRGMQNLEALKMGLQTLKGDRPNDKDEAVARDLIIRNMIKSGLFVAREKKFAITYFKPTMPSVVQQAKSVKKNIRDNIKHNLEKMNNDSGRHVIYYVDQEEGLFLVGWVASGLAFDPLHPIFVCLRGQGNKTFWTVSSSTEPRLDVEEAFSNQAEPLYSIGYQINTTPLNDIPAGQYEIDGYVVLDDKEGQGPFSVDFHIATLEVR